MSNCNETWKSIEGYPNYSVSDNGQVRNDKTGRILKTRVSNSGYLRCGLFDPILGQKSHSVHRLTAKSFIKNTDNKPQVNHIDGNKLNNHASNLEWITASENSIHAHTIGLSNHLHHMKPINQYTVMGEFVREWPSGSQAARDLGIQQGHISNCAKGKLNKSGGFIWKYKEQNTLIKNSPNELQR